MQVDYFHIPEANTLIEVIAGSVTLDSLIAMKKEEQEKDFLNSEVRILSVFLDATFDLNFEDVRQLTQWQTEHNQQQKGGQTALLADKPLATALNIYYSRETKDIRKMEVFSTLKGALEWLKLPKELVEQHWPQAKGLYRP